jgi:hypothetical protein
MLRCQASSISRIFVTKGVINNRSGKEGDIAIRRFTILSVSDI